MRSRRQFSVEELALHLLPDVPRGQAGPMIDWPGLFGNDHPVEIEVGFGRGLFLLNAGASRPDTNFFGIEIERKFQLYTATRLKLRNIGNVRLACGDALPVLRDCVPPASVQAVHVYFPDPWWKTRHRKRRLFTPEFATCVAGTLKPGGMLHIATDVENYFHVMLKAMNALPMFAPGETPAAPEAKDHLDYLTNFERKFRMQGLPIFRVAYVRV